MKLLKSAVLAAILLPLANMASAQLKFTALDARFVDPQPADNTTTVITPAPPTFDDPVSIAWGETASANAQQSGYSYDARETAFTESAGALFELGTFTHRNFPVLVGTSITGVDLLVRGSVEAVRPGGDIPLGEFQFSFNILHDETMNFPAGDNCPDGGVVGVGVNVDGCADGVSISPVDTTATFRFDDTEINLRVIGFAIPGGTIVSDTFWSPEEQANQRVLLAEFTEIRDPAEMPIPAPLLLIGAGLTGLYGVRRTRKRG